MDNCFLYNNCNHKNCDKFCPRHLKSAFLLEASGLPKSKWTKTTLVLDPDGTDLEAFKQLKDIESKIVSFVKNGVNLFIHSPISGNGKSSWLAKLLKSYFNQVWAGNGFKKRGYFLNLPTFLINLKESIRNPNSDFDDLKEFLKEVDLLCLDDIAASSLSEFEHNYLLYIIETRISNGLSTFYSSNLNEQNLLQYLGTRLKSRIFNNSQVICLQGQDRRGTQW